jgi:hypothetical protein
LQKQFEKSREVTLDILQGKPPWDSSRWFPHVFLHGDSQERDVD